MSDSQTECVSIVVAQQEASVWKMALAAAVSVLPGLGSGMSMALTAPLLEHFTNKDPTPLEEPLTEEEGSWLVSIPLLSMMLGVLSSGLLADRFGRKRTLVCSTLLLLLGWTLLFLADTLALLLLSRVVAGVVAGVSTTCSYVLLSEIALVRCRGVLTNCNTVSLNLAWLASLVLASSVSFEWTIMASTLPVMAFLALAFLVPESPLWHVSRQEVAKAERVMVRVRGEGYACVAELKELMHCAKERKGKTSVREKVGYLSSPAVVKPILLLSILFACQVTSGCEVISYYSLDIFKRANLPVDKYLLTCLIQTSFTAGYILAMPFMARVGRRTQFVLPSIVLSISMVVIGLCLHSQGSVQGAQMEWLVSTVPPVAAMVACFSYGLGVGPICFILLGELFPLRVKALGTSLVLSFRYVMSFAVLKAFPSLVSLLGLPAIFVINGFCSAFGCVVVLAFLPETKGLTLTQLATLFEGGKKVEEVTKEISANAILA